jgi:hypothetical protein
MIHGTINRKVRKIKWKNIISSKKILQCQYNKSEMFDY